ncbi:MAG: helix-turn-helix domain-containing protein, partial [Bacteroidales bacterium]|nr:helix-turn-helix domain-containing protein [Bacteroidales bacterium]
MKENLEIRRRITAEQIKYAMTKAGMTRSQLAAALGKKPSVITQWLSGKHNFTIDSLAEISSVLGQQITGVDERLNTKNIVSGYGTEDQKEIGVLYDSCSAEFSIDHIEL